MKVLVICPTYGRLPLLGRVLASFLDQDHTDKELIFINDDKNVQLTCDIENVHVLNLTKKITLGSKRNIGVSFGHYDLYMHYDDDDIFLPSRISNHVKFHISHPDAFFYWNTAAYYVTQDKFYVSGCSSSAGSLKREGWARCGGYADITKGEDVDFYNRIDNKFNQKDENNIDYVYNWGGINYHNTYSTEHDMTNEAVKCNKEYSVDSCYEIIPKWSEYCKFVELSTMYKNTQKPINIIHKELGVIDYLK